MYKRFSTDILSIVDMSTGFLLCGEVTRKVAQHYRLHSETSF